MSNDTTTSTEVHHEPNYMAIFGLLAALTLAEVGVTFLPLSRLVVGGMLVAMALVKAFLVAAYFMHLKFETKTLAMIAGIPLVLCTFLLLMLLPDAIV